MGRVIFFTAFLVFIEILFSCSSKNDADVIAEFVFTEKSEVTNPMSLTEDFQVKLFRFDQFPGGEIDKIIALDQGFLIADFDQLAAFAILDRDLELIRVVKKTGKGPGEFREIFDIGFDGSRIVLQAFGKLIYFDQQGNYLTEQRYGGFNMGNITFKDGMLVSETGNSPMRTKVNRVDKSIHILDSTLSVKAEWLPFDTKQEVSTLQNKKNFYSFSGELRYVPSVSNKIYTIYLDKEPTLTYTMHLSGFNEKVYEEYRGSKDDFIPYLLNSDFAWNIDNVVETEEFLFFSADFGSNTDLKVATKSDGTIRKIEIDSEEDVWFFLAFSSYLFHDQLSGRIFSFVESDLVLNVLETVEGEEKEKFLGYLDPEFNFEEHFSKYSLACISFQVK